MPSDAKRTTPATGSVSTPALPAIDDDSDASNLALGYEAADPMLLAALWGEPVSATGLSGDGR